MSETQTPTGALQGGPGETQPQVEEPAGPQASLWGDAWKELRRSPLFVISAIIILVLLVMTAVPQLFTRGDPRDCDLSRSLLPPSGSHWFGYDLQGCDYYTHVIYGARASISIGIGVTLSAVVVALVLGSLSGFYGGLLDSLISRISDVFFGLPFVLGAIVILSVVGDHGLLWVGLVLTLLGWPTMTRLTRSSVLSVKDSDYVHAARALGGSDFRLLTKHVLPNSLAPVIVYATIYVGIVISAEATLSFLGVGLQLPAISWGLMISGAQTRVLDAPHLLLFPGLFLSVTVLAFILMGDALRDALDPKLR
jgi:oligopeptide transport system permease protein